MEANNLKCPFDADEKRVVRSLLEGIDPEVQANLAIQTSLEKGIYS
jgi:hypothetical protein